MSEELKKISKDLDKLEAEKETWKEMYEMQTRLVLSLELDKIEKEKEIDSLKETLKLQKHVYDVGAEDLELDKRIEFLEETQKQLAKCIEKCWNCFGYSKFKIWDFVDGLELLVEKVQDVVEDERIHQKIVDQTYDILTGNPPVDLPKGIFSIPKCVENMFEELKDLVIENKRLEDKLERYRKENKTLQSYLDNINKNLKQMTGEK
jgi:hypothetical protein